MFTIENVRVKDIISMNSLSIHSGKTTCIIGPSGSGKSTFLRLLNNLDEPDEGAVFYKGKSIHVMDAIELRRKVVMLPQTPVIFDGTIRDNLLIGFTFSEQRYPDETHLTDALNEMQLSKQLDEDTSVLSGGEKQRLALARILLMDAETYLLDEPSSALDNKTANNVIEAFLKLAKANHKTVIMVTHDIELAAKVGDESIHMEQYSIALEKGAAK